MLPTHTFENVLRLDGRSTPTTMQVRIGEALSAAWSAIDAGDDGVRLDADHAAWSIRELEHVMADVYEVTYPDLPVVEGDLLEIDNDVPAGSLVWTYYMLDHTAVAAWIGNGGGEALPEVMVTGAQVTKPVHPLGNQYSYTTRDMRAAALSRQPLDRTLAKAAGRGQAQLKHWGGLFGSSPRGFEGLLNHPNITIGTAAAPVDTATIDQIIAMFDLAIEHAADVSNRRYQTTRVLMSQRVHRVLVRRRLGAGDGLLSVIDYLRKTWPRVEFSILDECDWRKAQQARAAAKPGDFDVDIDATTGDVLLAYVHNDRELARFVEPMAFTQLAPQYQGTRIVTPCEAEWGGLRLVAPHVFYRLEGVLF